MEKFQSKLINSIQKEFSDQEEIDSCSKDSTKSTKCKIILYIIYSFIAIIGILLIIIAVLSIIYYRRRYSGDYSINEDLKNAEKVGNQLKESNFVFLDSNAKIFYDFDNFQIMTLS